MISSSLPGLRGVVASTIFSIPYLEPAAASTVAYYTQFLDQAARGRSLVGVSILSGAFINMFWPLIALLVRWPTTSIRWKNGALICSVLAPFGIVMSYSRGAILGSILVLVGLGLFGSGRTRTVVLVSALGALLVFNQVGWESSSFRFERVAERTQAMFTDPYSDAREAERIFAYSEPFSHVLDNPQFLLMGEGTSIGKTGYTGEQASQANHAVFAQAYYSYGMLAAIAYVLLLLSAFYYLVRQITRRRPYPLTSTLFYQALFASLLGMLPWFAFGHAAVSTPRGAMVFFLLMGLIASLKQVEYLEVERCQESAVQWLKSLSCCPDKRSGSTMLQRELCSHPDIRHVDYSPHTYFETHHWLKGAVMLGMDPQLFAGARVYPGYGSRKNARAYLIDCVRTNVPDFEVPRDDRELVMEGWDALCETFARPVFFEKSPQHLAHWACLSLMLEWMERTEHEVSFIGLTRNPMSVMCSARKLFYTDPQIRQFGWLALQRNLLAFFRLLPAGSYLHLRYEDVIANPPASLSEVMEFLGVSRCLALGAGVQSRPPDDWRSDADFHLHLDPAVRQVAECFGYTERELGEPSGVATAGNSFGARFARVSPRGALARLNDRWLKPMAMRLRQ